MVTFFIFKQSILKHKNKNMKNQFKSIATLLLVLVSLFLTSSMLTSCGGGNDPQPVVPVNPNPIPNPVGTKSHCLITENDYATYTYDTVNRVIHEIYKSFDNNQTINNIYLNTDSTIFKLEKTYMSPDKTKRFSYSLPFTVDAHNNVTSITGLYPLFGKSNSYYFDYDASNRISVLYIERPNDYPSGTKGAIKLNYDANGNITTTQGVHYTNRGSVDFTGAKVYPISSAGSTLDWDISYNNLPNYTNNKLYYYAYLLAPEGSLNGLPLIFNKNSTTKTQTIRSGVSQTVINYVGNLPDFVKTNCK